MYSGWAVCIPPPKWYPLGYNEPCKKIGVFLNNIFKLKESKQFPKLTGGDFGNLKGSLRKEFLTCSRLQLWLQTCLEVHCELLDTGRMLRGGTEKTSTASFSYCIYKVGHFCPLHQSEYLLMCLCVSTYWKALNFFKCSAMKGHPLEMCQIKA